VCNDWLSRTTGSGNAVPVRPLVSSALIIIGGGT